ncbi:MAG: ABC transporter permease [Candidatus Promineifilaceae bacterium]
MNDSELVLVLSSIMLQSAPLIIAVCGEILTERSGVVNLSLDGSLLLAALAGFVAALAAGSVWVGFLAAAAVGASLALIVALGSIRLGQNQVAVGFVLTLLADDLSAFLGQRYTRLPGPTVARGGIPLLEEIPLLGPIFFDQDIVVYFALALVVVCWWFLNRSQPGLRLRSAGERPEAAYARGVNVNRQRYLYALVGGALVGVAGAAYSLDVKIGWSEGHTRGIGWITLAIVIFGGWSPLRGALGALLFGATKALATVLQRGLPGVPVVAFNAIPWLLMIAVLLAVESEGAGRLINLLPRPARRPLRSLLRVASPLALGQTFEPDK